ncbi:GNAT family N-acetyltransferase [Methylobacillus gramineus]|uniref:GNAT family N-acetyltransferase n=1 Tax=Methylobacillus gramineus TaxID=755169 RepID=UPI001CFF59BA|nr:GNAT family N-acetyltransferase [Methylobacillus gramineus]MCB5185237.1 GNAT family N-acetyltransferase [Methylobacillus gramineus]
MNELSDPVNIESARLTDVPALCHLLQQLFSIEQDFTPDLEKQRAGLTLLIQQPDRGTIMVARNAEGHAIGMISAQLVISTAEGAPSAWIEDMVIDSAWRNRGLGKSLLQAILNWASQQGATRAQLLVDMDNTPAIAYYDHLGWHTSRLQMRSLFL